MNKLNYIYKDPYHRTELWKVVYKGWHVDKRFFEKKEAKKFLAKLVEQNLEWIDGYLNTVVG